MEVLLLTQAKKNYYTVEIQMEGFPVFFYCPSCKMLHSYPERYKEAKFEDPGEASSSFKTLMSVFGAWEYVEPNELIEMVLHGK